LFEHVTRRKAATHLSMETRMKKLIVLAVAGLSLASAGAYAQMQHQGSQRGGPMMGPGMMQGQMPGMQGQQAKGDQSPASLAFQAINVKMHDAMNIAFSGNADVDFVKGMIPHHQGAIDMAKTVLAFGKDPETKKLAEEIIKAQESEIALMQAWLKKNGQ
jgi:uncharacterized protein (DUF305 family)